MSPTLQALQQDVVVFQLSRGLLSMVQIWLRQWCVQLKGGISRPGALLPLSSQRETPTVFEAELDGPATRSHHQ